WGTRGTEAANVPHGDVSHRLRKDATILLLPAARHFGRERLAYDAGRALRRGDRTLQVSGAPGGRTDDLAAARFRRMGGLAGKPADRARDGEPAVAASFRRRHCAHAEQLRQTRRASVASGIAGLAGRSLSKRRLEHEVDAPPDDELAAISDRE